MIVLALNFSSLRIIFPIFPTLSIYFCNDLIIHSTQPVNIISSIKRIDFDSYETINFTMKLEKGIFSRLSGQLEIPPRSSLPSLYFVLLCFSSTRGDQQKIINRTINLKFTIEHGSAFVISWYRIRNIERNGTMNCNVTKLPFSSLEKECVIFSKRNTYPFHGHGN